MHELRNKSSYYGYVIHIIGNEFQNRNGKLEYSRILLFYFFPHCNTELLAPLPLQFSHCLKMEIFLWVLFVCSRENNVFLCACLIPFYSLVFIHLEIESSLVRKKIKQQEKETEKRQNIIPTERTTQPATRGSQTANNHFFKDKDLRELLGFFFLEDTVDTLRKSNPP